MALALGVDTGGTYTDAVLIEDEARIVAQAKSLTTRGDLALGIAASIDAVLSESGAAAGDIGLVSLSTTLATNALVEGQGERIGLVFIGFEERDLARQGLGEALGDDPVIRVSGGHDHTGAEAAALDLAHIEQWLEGVDVSGFAVAAQFAVRNPAHEAAVRDLIRARTAKPVSCSSDLSAQLGGPKRAMTAVLNARLIGLIDRLIVASEGLLKARGISAPLMVVRGDGALIAAEIAREKPIETILSGPAASLVGAAWLTDEKSALVSDIGGTTTDVALLVEGRPRIDPDGAQVGGLRTMVEAVALRTTGLGGDSAVRIEAQGSLAGLILGPRRLVPVAMLAADWPDLVHRVLDKQLEATRSGEFDGRFVVPLPGVASAGLGARESALLKRLGDEARPFGDLVQSRMDLTGIDRLRGLGLLQIAGVTPTDAAHVIGLQSGFDRDAAEKALKLFARQKSGIGEVIWADAAGLAADIIAQLQHQTCEVLLEAALAEDGVSDASGWIAHPMAQSALRGLSGVVAKSLSLGVPVVGLGASAQAYYPRIGDVLGCDVLLPEAGGVANAIGAVVGQVTIRKMISVTTPSEGVYLIHSGEEPERVTDQAVALDLAETRLRAVLATEVAAAGAVDAGISIEQDVRTSEIEGREMFVEAVLKGEARGRPRVSN